MSMAWYIVPYKIERENGHTYRYVALCDFHKQVVADNAKWTETEVLGDRAIVKIRASDSLLTILDTKYKRLPKDRLNDSLDSLSSNVRTDLKNEVLNMGYALTEVQAKFGSDFGRFTLRDVLKFMTKRRLKPRYDKEVDTIICDGIEQKCRSIESVDSEIQ